MEADKIQIKPITLAKTAFRAESTKNASDSPAKNTTDLKNMPVSAIDIKTPIPYATTGDMPLFNDLKAKTYRLANGQKVIVLPKKGPTVVKTYVNVGSMNEPDNLRGISHFIEHNLFNGTQNLKAGDFFRKVNELGASTNASTSFSTTDYYIRSQLLKEGDLEEKIKMHADMLQNPTFAPDMLEKERGPVISEISMVMDDPQNTAINRAIKNLYQIKTTSPDLIAGTVANIQNVTGEDVLNYYKTHYTPNNMTTVITGDVEPDEAIKLISKYFTKQNPQKPTEKKFETLTPIEKSIRTDEISNKATSSTIVTAFAGPENNNTKDKIAVEVLVSILAGSQNSKLKKALEALHINIDAGIEKIGNQDRDRKALLFTTACSPEKVDSVIKTVYKEIFDVQTGKLTQKEFDIAKKQITNAINDVSENSAVLNSFIGSSLMDNDPAYIKNYKNILNNLTLQDIQTTANKYLDLNKASIAVINPPKQKNTQQSVSFGSK